MMKTVLVLGATGDQGHPLLTRMRAAGLVPVAALRNPAALAKTECAEVDAVEADLYDMASLVAAAKGMDAPRLLAVDNEVVVPVDAVVHVLLTARDVIHAWTIPSFGSKADAVPGRLTSTWFKATKKGVFYGQCSELCGKDHAFMPIAVRVVDRGVYDQWVTILKGGAPDADQKAKELIEKAALEDKSRQVAAAQE